MRNTQNCSTVKGNRNAHVRQYENLKEEETSVICTPQKTLQGRRAGVSVIDWLLPDSKMEDRALHKKNKTKYAGAIKGRQCCMAESLLCYIWGQGLQESMKNRDLKLSV